MTGPALGPVILPQSGDIMKIIGLTGPAGAGKSTIAHAIVEASHIPAAVVSFATPMKVALLSLFTMQGLETSKGAEMLLKKKKEEPTDYLMGKSPRQALQTLGTEWGRHCIHPMFWVEVAFRFAKSMGYTHIIIDDVRFDNEVEAITYRSGAIVEVVRKGAEYNDAHVSARRLDVPDLACTVYNEGTPQAAAESILMALRDYWV